MLINRKIEAIERRLTKVMASDPTAREALEPAFNAIHAAFIAINEGKVAQAEQSLREFNKLMKEYRNVNFKTN